MTQLFTASDYAKIHSLVFRDDYPGYKPNVVESPNGDGKLDTEKRYAHVAEKYLFQQNEYTIRYEKANGFHPSHERDTLLQEYLNKAHDLSIQVAIAIGVPRPFWPVKKYGALRVLEYNGEAVTNPHKDFDLFTLMLYRNDESCFRYIDDTSVGCALPEHSFEQRQKSLVAQFNSEGALKKAQSLNSQIHFGEILEEIDPNRFVANKHEVVASGGPWQYSIVHFSIPDHSVILPCGIDVAEWLRRRMERSRYER